MLTAEKDLPIETRIYSGNEDDKTISKGILKRISAYMAGYGIDSKGFIYTGDSVMVTEQNLVYMGGTGDPKVKFISRMPATFGMVDILIAEATAKMTGAILECSLKIKKRAAPSTEVMRET